MAMKPKSVSRPKRWSEEVEEAYRFQVAGYRDENEYKEIKNSGAVSAVFFLSVTIFTSQMFCHPISYFSPYLSK